MSSGSGSLAEYFFYHVADRPIWKPIPGLPGIPLPVLPSFEILGVQIDPSISLHVLMLLFASVATGLFLRSASRRSADGLLPSGPVGHAMEALLMFIRDDVVRPTIGAHEGDRWMPFLGTLFLFILVLNLMGLVPLFAGTTANISVTAAFGVMVFVIFNVAGMTQQGPFHYVKSLMPSGVPIPVLIILAPIEILALFTRAFSLTLRLFANMTAGKIMVLAFSGLISIFSTILPSDALTLGGVAPLAVASTVFILVIKVGVCFLQAYVFTLLSSLYIGGAIHSDH